MFAPASEARPRAPSDDAELGLQEAPCPYIGIKLSTDPASHNTELSPEAAVLFKYFII